MIGFVASHTFHLMIGIILHIMMKEDPQLLCSLITPQSCFLTPPPFSPFFVCVHVWGGPTKNPRLHIKVWRAHEADHAEDPRASLFGGPRAASLFL